MLTPSFCILHLFKVKYDNSYIRIVFVIVFISYLIFYIDFDTYFFIHITLIYLYYIHIIFYYILSYYHICHSHHYHNTRHDISDWDNNQKFSLFFLEDNNQIKLSIHKIKKRVGLLELTSFFYLLEEVHHITWHQTGYEVLKAVYFSWLNPPIYMWVLIYSVIVNKIWWQPQVKMLEVGIFPLKLHLSVTLTN